MPRANGNGAFLRQDLERREHESLSPFAAFSDETKGRDIPRPLDPYRSEFQRDRERILHCKSFRRLSHKTQVFLAPEGDHYRTRMTHTLDVAQIASSIARALRLNEDLVEAIALGHDLGHPPFGHTGEKALNNLTDGKFLHNEQSVRVVEVLEREGKGLNLTKEVTDGILNHRSGGSPKTLEGKVVLFADKIAYINHDIDDALRAGALKEGDLPKACTAVIGRTATERINNMIMSIYRRSDGKPFVDMEPGVFAAMQEMRKFLFESVYTAKDADGQGAKAERLVEILYGYFFSNPDTLPEFFRGLVKKDGREKAVCDYVASMSDSYATNMFYKLFVPESRDVL